MKIKLSTFIIILFITPIVLFYLFLYIMSFKNITLEEMVVNKQYNKAIYIFQWEKTLKVLTDEHKRIIKIYGYDRDRTSYEVVDDLLIVNFDNDGAILKSENDSISIREDCTKLHGWMGAHTGDSWFEVDQNGTMKILFNGRYRDCIKWK